MRQTDYVILGLLAERPLSGYQIKKIIDIRFQFFWSESFGQIFPALKSGIRMVAPPHTPVPFSPTLEDLYIPSAAAIAAAVRQTVKG